MQQDGGSNPDRGTLENNRISIWNDLLVLKRSNYFQGLYIIRICAQYIRHIISDTSIPEADSALVHEYFNKLSFTDRLNVNNPIHKKM